MNFYYIGRTENTALVFKYGIAAGSPICTSEEYLLKSAINVYDRWSVQHGKVAAFKIDFPEIEQEQLLTMWAVKGCADERETALVKFKCEIPPEWVKAAFVVLDYERICQQDIIL